MRNARLVSEHDMLQVMYCGPGFLDVVGLLDRPAKDSLDGADLLDRPAKDSLDGADLLDGPADSLSVSCRHH